MTKASLARENRPSQRPSVWLLGLASGISPFGITMAVPLLASIAEQFQASFGSVQFIISAYLLGLAAAQPFNGFLCDRFGRRSVMLTGFAVFVVASIGAALVQSLEAMIVLRFIQASGVSVGTVASRAVVRDTRGAVGSAEALSYIAAITGFAPIVAPILGGWLGAVGGYPLVFMVTAIMGAVTWLLMYFYLPETLDKSTARPQWQDWLRNYQTLLRSHVFLGYSLMFGFVQGSFFCFLAVGAAVFEHDFGIGSRGFGLIWGALAITYVAGAMLSGRMIRRFGPSPVMRMAVLSTLLAGWIMTLMVTIFGVTLFSILLPLSLLMSAAGGISPGALAGAVNAHPEMTGTSSGLSSALGIVLGGVFTVLAGVVYSGSFIPVAWLVAASTTLTWLSWLMVRRMEH
jgi:DHA1 family bicyclomycin/chloramphenicol resistance-like MFS transporter